MLFNISTERRFFGDTILPLELLKKLISNDSYQLSANLNNEFALVKCILSSVSLAHVLSGLEVKAQLPFFLQSIEILSVFGPAKFL